MEIIYENLDHLADLATVLGLILALIEAYKRQRMGRKK